MKQNIIQTKKGIPLNQAFGAVLTLVLIGILVIVAIFLFVNLGDTFTTTSASTTNETGVTVNASANSTTYIVTNASDCNFNSPALTAIWGFPPQLTPTIFNYTIALANATISSAGVVENASEFNVTVLNHLNFSCSFSSKSSGFSSYIWF